jgi:SAM-dependent methyltransferase
MRWRLKAAVQNAIASLPEQTGNRVYFWLQRRLGGLKRVTPVSRMKAAIETWRHCQTHGLNPVGKTFLEIGTGHVPDAPIAYWLMGAGRVITIDLHRYLSAQLIDESLAYAAEHREEIAALFGSLLVPERLEALEDHRDVLRAIEYVAPGDASATGLADGSVDVHTSYTVLEHIPASVLAQILREGDRVVAPGGLFVHRVDYTDHFAHADETISHVNFLQYSDREWERFAGNRFMFMNRLRHADFMRLFMADGRQLIHVETETHAGVAQALRTLHLDDRFAAMSRDMLEITGGWFVARPLAREVSA